MKKDIKNIQEIKYTLTPSDLAKAIINYVNNTKVENGQMGITEDKARIFVDGKDALPEAFVINRYKLEREE